jgi:hypothetical protein
MNYNQKQVDEMIARVQGMFKSFGAGLAGAGAGGMAPSAPPSQEPAAP